MLRVIYAIPNIVCFINQNSPMPIKIQALRLPGFLRFFRRQYMLLATIIFCLFCQIDMSVAEPDGIEDEKFIQQIQIAEDEDFDKAIYFEQRGKSSWYHNRFHNRKTSNGERYQKEKFTAAHKTLPFGTVVKVSNPKNHKAVFVRVNDRGPFSKRKIIDLSKSAAKSLGAFSNPQVLVQAVLPEKMFDCQEEAANYFITFSYEEKPKCSLAKNFTILLEYDDFDDAVEEFAKICKYNKSHRTYLLTTPHIDPDFHDDEKNTGKYYIGYKTSSLNMSYLDTFYK